MKEMTYGPQRTFEVLDNGTYRGVPYWIVSRGTHPCCYLDVTQYMVDHGIKDVECDDDGNGGLDIDCHGGLSYTDDHLGGVWDKDVEGFEPGKKIFVGWHYLHTGDHGGEEHFDEIMNEGTVPFEWTTEELIHDTKRSIDSLFPYESKYGLAPMVYQGKSDALVLGSGVLNGVPWWIISYGSHPCAYVEVTKLSDAQADTIAWFAHDSITYNEDHLSFANWDPSNPEFKHGERKFLGWDYGHMGDYTNDTPKSRLGARLFWAANRPDPPPKTASKEERMAYRAKVWELTRWQRRIENSFIREGHRWSSDEIYEEVKTAIEKATKV